MIIPYRGKYPDIHPSAFITPQVSIIGDVRIESDVSVWFGTVIRGDVHEVRIGPRTNIQDNCTLHETHEKYPLHIGADVTVGHAAVLHGCSIGDGCLIGMGAIILDNARIGKECLVAAGAVVREHSDIPDGALLAGVPAKIVRMLSEEERRGLKKSAEKYMDYVGEYRLHDDLAGAMPVDRYQQMRAEGKL
jgi:carbonic anhydrase/acetyltransferase-like protein (isoleucine patch superfamily)